MINEFLEPIQWWFNKNIAAANILGVLNIIWTLGYSYFLIKTRQRKQQVEINVTTATDKVDKLEIQQKLQNEKLTQIEHKIDVFADIMFTVFNVIKIPSEAKLTLAKLYASVKQDINTLPITEVEEKTVEPEELQPINKQEEQPSLYEQLRESIIKQTNEQI